MAVVNELEGRTSFVIAHRLSTIPDLDSTYRAPLQVVYDTKESDRHPLAVVAQFVAGGSAALPDTYGMSATSLADLMNRYRTRRPATNWATTASG